MIQMPRRSVTRFFIPLIDVLTLLFCIFLLMPLVKAPAETGDGDRTDGDRTGQEAKPGDDVKKLHAEIDRLKEEKGQVLQRMVVRVLEIDPADGRLFYYGPQRVEVTDEDAAHRLIDNDRDAIGPGRDLYYEILYPRDPASPYPLLAQRKKYDEWFKDVPHGWDIPGAPLKGVKP